MIEITETERGFHNYGPDLVDTYENVAYVRESSAASGPHVWLFVKNGRHITPEPGESQLHLNEEQARGLIARLQAWLDEIPTRWGREAPEG